MHTINWKKMFLQALGVKGFEFFTIKLNAPAISKFGIFYPRFAKLFMSLSSNS